MNVSKQNKCGVYFYYDAAGELLYIGKAIDVGDRWIGHRESWKKDVKKVGVCLCQNEAEMDFAERYFIARYPTKYNKAYVKDMYIDWEVIGLSQQTIYSVEEFKKKFVKKSKRELEPVLPIDERLVAMGNTIIDVDGDVNLFDEKWLQMDLDRVVFRHRGIYLISRYASIPGRPHKKKEQDLSFRTNDTISALYRYFNEFAPQVRPGEYEMEEVHTLVFPGTKEECHKFVDAVHGFPFLYDLYKIKIYRDRERLDNMNTCFVSVVHGATAWKATNNSFEVEFSWSTKRQPEGYLPLLNADMYVFPFIGTDDS